MMIPSGTSFPPPPTPTDLHSSILISSWICSLLFMLVIRETIRYYTSFQSDALGLKIFVAVAVAVDAASLVADYSDVYLVRLRVTFYYLI